MSGLPSSDHEYREINRRGWSRLVQEGCSYTRPVRANDLPHARTILDPKGWIAWDRIHNVLCLASGGGQQGPLAASLGKRVTVADLSPEQLAQDRLAASELGLDIETIELDMQDLSPLHGRKFDMVYQPVSCCYVPDVRRVYHEVARVIAPRGLYLVNHWNTTLIQMPDTGEWDGSAYRLVTPQIGSGPVPQINWHIDGHDHAITTWLYTHSLEDLIGGLLDADFTLKHFAEAKTPDLAASPGSINHIAAFAPPMFRLLAQAPG